MAETNTVETVDIVNDNFLFALSNYSECIKPFLRTAQDRYIGQYYSVDEQPFDFSKYCATERKLCTDAKLQIQATIQL